MQYRPFFMPEFNWILVLLVLPSMTAMKLSVTTIPSSHVSCVCLPTSFCSIILILKYMDMPFLVTMSILHRKGIGYHLSFLFSLMTGCGGLKIGII